MQNQASSIPVEIQLQVVCQPPLQRSYEILVSYLPELQLWNPQEGSNELFIERTKEYLSFTTIEFGDYLKAHPETCLALLNASYDERYSPLHSLRNGDLENIE